MTSGLSRVLIYGEKEMDFEKLEKMAKLFLKETPTGRSPLIYKTGSVAKFRNLMQMASQVLPDHQALFVSAVSGIDFSLTLSDADSFAWRLLAILETEKYRERQASKS
jgi:hypothetical protein